MPATSAEPGRCSLVTGGARGIGRAICVHLAARGDHVVVADTDTVAAAECARAILESGWSAHAVELDVTDVAAVRRTISETDAERPLRTVVSSAGIVARRAVTEIEPEEFDRVNDVNVRGLFFVMQAALRAMLPRGTGSIVNISSTSAFTASTGPLVPYDASKAAVRMLTQAAAREVAASGVRINAVAPGTVETDLTRGLASREELAQLASQRVPMKRLGLPEEIAAAVGFLASDEASYITGHVLVVDGGWLA